jgi:colicin import membrane protein
VCKLAISKKRLERIENERAAEAKKKEDEKKAKADKRKEDQKAEKAALEQQKQLEKTNKMLANKEAALAKKEAAIKAAEAALKEKESTQQVYFDEISPPRHIGQAKNKRHYKKAECRTSTSRSPTPLTNLER